MHEHRLQGDSKNVKLVNYGNLAYVGPVYFTDQFQGSENGKVTNYVYDTGSGDLTTTSTNCVSGCATKVYNQEQSTTAKKIDGSDTTLSYGSATLDGYFVKDTVCLGTEASFCVKDF